MVDAAATDTERKALGRETGTTGESIFYHPVKDLVIDVMHALTLDLICSEVRKHLANMGANQARTFSNWDTSIGRVMDRKDLVAALTHCTH